MKEAEITVQVFNGLDEINNILNSKGFNMIEKYHMTDWYFSKYDDVSKLGYAELMNKSFLVRNRNDKKYMCLCYKKKNYDLDGNVISEEKLIANTPDTLTAVKIFQSAGLNNYCIVENDSYIYKNDSIMFAVQVIKNLGIFIELEENESMQKMNDTERFNYMKSIVNSLGLNLGKDYSCKKVFMLLHNCD